MRKPRWNFQKALFTISVITLLTLGWGMSSLGCPSYSFTKTAEILSGPVENKGDYFLVTALKTLVEWKVTIKVVNESNETFSNVVVTDNFAGDLGVATISKDPPSSTLNYTYSGATQKVHLEWIIGSLSPHTTATLVMRVYTDVNPGGQQEYTSPCWHYLNSGAVLKFKAGGTKYSKVTPPIKVKVLEAECPTTCKVTVSATRIDWKVRKPGTFSAHAFDIFVEGDCKIRVSFSGFDNLQREGDTQTIATFYGEGIDPGSISWFSANELNGRSYLLFPGVTISLWDKIEVSQFNSSCEYEDAGVIIFAVCNQ